MRVRLHVKGVKLNSGNRIEITSMVCRKCSEILEVIRNMGLEIEERAKAKGISGLEHTFLARASRGGRKVYLDYAESREALIACLGKALDLDERVIVIVSRSLYDKVKDWSLCRKLTLVNEDNISIIPTILEMLSGS